MSDTGPPTTHPSAGLSYLRSAALLQNHPVLGPQSNHTPVQARVLQARQSARGNNDSARLGVAGIVVKDNKQYSDSNRQGRQGEKGVDISDFTTKGGAKVWVEPLRASIESTGKIKLDVERALPEAIDVREGKLVSRIVQRPHVDNRLGTSQRFDERLDAVPPRRSPNQSLGAMLR